MSRDEQGHHLVGRRRAGDLAPTISLKIRAASAAVIRLRFLPPSRNACSRPYASSQKVFWFGVQVRVAARAVPVVDGVAPRLPRLPLGGIGDLGPEVVPVIESTTKPVASFEETVIMSLTARTSSGLSASLPASFCAS